jgi:hypothetical protein
MDKERGEELVHEIGERILGDPAVENAEWDALAVIAEVDEIVTITAFGYLGGSTQSLALTDDDLPGLIEEFRAATSDRQSPPWKACLIQIVADTMEIDIAFEHDDPDRWRVTPENFESLPAELNPLHGG